MAAAWLEHPAGSNWFKLEKLRLNANGLFKSHLWPYSVAFSWAGWATPKRDGPTDLKTTSCYEFFALFFVSLLISNLSLLLFLLRDFLSHFLVCQSVSRSLCLSVRLPQLVLTLTFKCLTAKIVKGLCQKSSLRENPIWDFIRKSLLLRCCRARSLSFQRKQRKEWKYRHPNQSLH